MSPKHRHFLGVPVFLLLVGMALTSPSDGLWGEVTSSTPPAAAGEITARGGDKEFSLTHGIYGVLHEDGVLSDDGVRLSLDDGTALMASDGMITLRAGDSLLSGFHGAFLATRSADRVSVWALTAPVLLVRDEFRLVVPQGMHGSFAINALPSTFSLTAAAESRSTLQVIDAGAARDQLQVLARLAPVVLPVDTLSPLHALRIAVQSGDRAAAHALLQQAELQNLLLGGLPAEIITAPLSAAEAMPSIAQELLQSLTDENLWLLASLHPAYRDAAWETSGPAKMPLQPRLLRWLELPSSAVTEGLSQRVVDRWQEQVHKYLLTRDDADVAEFLHALLLTLSDYRTFAEDNGFPERLTRIAGALTALVDPLRDLLPTAEDEELYARWSDIGTIPPYSDPPPSPNSEPEPVPVELQEEPAAEAPFDPAVVQAQAKQMLLGAGALFTTQTVLQATTATQVTVSGLLFASEDGEHTYDAVLDLPASQMSAIHRDGELLPYALSLEAFGKWAGR